MTPWSEILKIHWVFLAKFSLMFYSPHVSFAHFFPIYYYALVFIERMPDLLYNKNA